jgi:hypothetical protein
LPSEVIVKRACGIARIFVLGLALLGTSGCLVAPADESEAEEATAPAAGDRYQLPSAPSNRRDPGRGELEQLEGGPSFPLRCPDLWGICLSACAGENPVVPDECPVPECVCPPDG